MLIILSTQMINAQFCGFDTYINNNTHDNDYIELINNELDDIQEMSEYLRSNNIQMDVTIPIIFHIINEGEPVGSGNNLNSPNVYARFNDLNSIFENTGIQFCLANHDENGLELLETGINRIDASSVNTYVNNNGVYLGFDSEYQIKNLSEYFSTYLYLNVWVVKNINSNNVNGVIQGHAHFPNTVDKTLDGILLRSSTFSHTNSSVLAHEIGHHLGLFHTFQGDDRDMDGIEDSCPSISDDFPLSDEISDTDPHIRSSNQLPCPSGNNTCTGLSNLDELSKNYMDYSNILCHEVFTSEQVSVMQASIMEKRGGYILSTGCESCASSIIPNLAYSPENPVYSDDILEAVPAELNTTTVADDYEWIINEEVISSESMNTYYFPSSGLYNVCLSIINDNCQSIKCEKINVHIDNLCYDDVIPFCELILNGNMLQVNEGRVTSVANGERIHFPHATQHYDLICNWTNYIPENGTIVSPEWFRPSDGSLPYIKSGFTAKTHNSPQSESMGLLNPIGFVDGSSYEVSFEYSFKNLFEGPNDGFANIYLALSNSVEEKQVDDFKIIETGPVSASNSNQINLTFKEIKYSFDYNDDMGKYVYYDCDLNNDTDRYILNIKNISIKECDFCAAEPEFSYIQSECNTFTFVGSNQNPNAPGFVSWSLDGFELPPFSGQYEIEDYSFPFTGEFEFCMNITCPNGQVQQDCKTITVGEYLGSPCLVCDGINPVAVSATNCADAPDELIVESFPISVPKGYGPCATNTFFSSVSNGEIFLNDYYIDDSSPTDDIIYISFTYIAVDINAPIGGRFVVCSPDGLSSYCFGLIFDQINTCDQCLDGSNFVQNISVNCVDDDLTDDVFVYRGNIDLFLPDYVNDCGFSSTNSGLNLDLDNINSNGVAVSIPFTINTNNSGSFNTSTSFCYINDDDEMICIDISIRVDNPCMPDPDNCEIDIPPTTIACDEVVGGQAIFDFSYSLHLPEYIKDGWEYCEDSEITSSSGRAFTYESWTGIGAYIFIIRHEVSCADIAAGYQLDLLVSLCRNGEQICVDLPINMMCEDCGEGSFKRSTEIGSEQGEIRVYPNPSNSQLFIDINADQKGNTYSIFRSDGILEMSGNLPSSQNIINHNLQNGLYILKIGDDYFSKILVVK